MSNLAPVEKAHVDAVFGPDGTEQANDNPLDPCPVCDARPEDSPEGVHDQTSARKHGVAFDTAKWVFDHCWRCGHRPGTNVNRKSVAQMRSEFERFMSSYQDEFSKLSEARGIAAPSNENEVNELKRQIAELQAERDRRNAPVSAESPVSEVTNEGNGNSQ